MPDWLSRLLVAGAPIVEERSGNDIECARGADDLRTIANACDTTLVLMYGNLRGVHWGLALYDRWWLSDGLLFSHVEEIDSEACWSTKMGLGSAAIKLAMRQSGQSSFISQLRATHQLLCARTSVSSVADRVTLQLCPSTRYICWQKKVVQADSGYQLDQTVR